MRTPDLTATALELCLSDVEMTHNHECFNGIAQYDIRCFQQGMREQSSTKREQTGVWIVASHSIWDRLKLNHECVLQNRNGAREITGSLRHLLFSLVMSVPTSARGHSPFSRVVREETANSDRPFPQKHPFA